MAVSLSSIAAVKICDFITSLFNEGTAVDSGYVRIYSGPKPVNNRAALVGANLVLVELDSPADAFSDAAANDVAGYAEALANPIPDTPATSDGEATFFRQFNRNNEAVYQGDVSAANGGAEMELSSTSLIAGINAVVQSYAIRYPMG